jgi:hypothetical protein
MNNSLKKISGLYESLPIIGPCPLFVKKEHSYVYSRVYYCRMMNLNSFYKIMIFVPALILWYFKAIVVIVTQLRLFSAKVRKTNNIPIYKQTFQLLVLSFIKNSPADLYYYLKLYNKQFPIAEDYLINKHIGPILRFLTKHEVQRAIVCNKFDFWMKLRPVISNQPDIVAVVTKGKIEFIEPYDDFLESDYFLKPNNGFGGSNCFRITYLGDLLYEMEPLELVFNKADLKKYLIALSRKGDFIIQPVLLNHPDVLVLSNGSLVTSRIVTYLDKNDEVQLLFGQLYMPVEDSLTSNTNAIGCALDRETGILSSAINLSDPFKKIDFHPDGKGKITSAVLPFWTEAIDLCKKAHNEFRELPIIGWDVAFTPKGPFLIEGNLIWDVEYWQLTHKDRFKNDDFISILEMIMKKHKN